MNPPVLTVARPDLTPVEQVMHAGVVACDPSAPLAAARGDTTAGQVAATELVTVEPAESVAGAAQLMAEHDFSHLVVVERDFPVGIISSLDVAHAAGDR